MAGNTVSASGVVADDQRGARFPLLMSWWTTCSAIFYLYLGPTLAVAYGSKNAIIGILLTIVTYALVAWHLARRSVATGLSAELMSERMFGRAGASVAALILGLTALYYAVFEGSILAIAVSHVFGFTGYVGACLLVVVLSIPFVLSDRILVHFERANFVLLPVYLIGLTALVICAGSAFGWSAKWLEMGPPVPSSHGWWDCYVAYLGVSVLLVITPDFARFGRQQDVRFHAGITFGLPFYVIAFLVNGVIGIFLIGTIKGSAVSEAAIVDASLLVLGGAAGLAFIAATQLRINLANFYVSSFNVSSFIETMTGRRPPYWMTAIAVCAVAFVLMATQSAFQYMILSLKYMGIFLCSWLGVALLALGGDHEEATEVANPRKIRTALWCLSAALGIIVAFGSTIASSSAPAVSFLSAFILTWLLGRVNK